MTAIKEVTTADFDLDEPFHMSLSVAIFNVKTASQQQWKWKLVNNLRELNLPEACGCCDSEAEAKSEARRAVSKYLQDQADTVADYARRVTQRGLDWNDE